MVPYDGAVVALNRLCAAFMLCLAVLFDRLMFALLPPQELQLMRDEAHQARLLAAQAEQARVCHMCIMRAQRHLLV